LTATQHLEKDSPVKDATLIVKEDKSEAAAGRKSLKHVSSSTRLLLTFKIHKGRYKSYINKGGQQSYNYWQRTTLELHQ